MEEPTLAKPKTTTELALESLETDQSFKGLNPVKLGVLIALINTVDFQNSRLEINHRASIALSTVKITVGKPGVQDPLRESTVRFRKSVEAALRFVDRGSKD